MTVAVEEKPVNRTKVWFLVHSWLAMPIWFFVFFICLTGTIATISQEILWLVDPAVRANPPEKITERLSYDEVIEVIKRDNPEIEVRSITRPVKSVFALEVAASYPDSTEKKVYVNPYTGEIQGTSSDFDFRGFMRSLHGWLLMPWQNGFSFGWYLVCATAIPMFLSLITGLIIYKRFWRGFLSPRLRFNRGARVFWGDFHRLAGLWSIPFILIISITGTWFLVQGVLWHNNISISSQGPPIYIDRKDVPTVNTDETVPVISPDEATAVVAEAYPSWQPSGVYMPSNAYTHYYIYGRNQYYPLIFENFQVNPYTGGIDKQLLLSDLSGLELFSRSMFPLHFGNFVGLGLKLVYFFFGVLLTMMTFSGMMIWSKRTFRDSAAVMREKKMLKRRDSAQRDRRLEMAKSSDAL